MKYLLFLAVTFLVSSTVRAQSESTFFKIWTEEESTTYRFDSIKDFEENIEKILIDFETVKDKKKREKSEDFWVEISITVSNSKESTTITRSVNTNDTSIINDATKLKKQIDNMLALL